MHTLLIACFVFYTFRLPRLMSMAAILDCISSSLSTLFFSIQINHLAILPPAL